MTVIGGGAAGLTAAFFAAEEGAQVRALAQQVPAAQTPQGRH